MAKQMFNIKTRFQTLSRYKKLFVVFLLLLGIMAVPGLLIANSFGLSLTKGIVTKQGTPEPQDKNITLDCGDWDLGIDELEDYIKTNKVAMQLIQDNCLWVLESHYFDVTGDELPELFLNTSGAGCASCHTRELYVLEGNHIIFWQHGDDIEVRKTNKVTGFELKEPLRKSNEGYCCPSEGIVTTYQYSPAGSQDDQFYPYDERIEAYASSGELQTQNKSQNSSTPVPKSTPSPPSPSPTPAINKDEGKQQALAAIDAKINGIDQKIDYAQRIISSLLLQEQQSTCSTDRYSDPESEMFIEDPYSREMLCAGRSQQYFYYINQVQQQINVLVQERNELERQKFLIMSQ